MSLENDIIILKKRLDSANETVKNQEFEINNLQQQLILYEAQKKQWEQQKIIQQTIMQQTLAGANTTNTETSEELQKVKDELREVKAELEKYKD